jgi:hypothetical protein
MTDYNHVRSREIAVVLSEKCQKIRLGCVTPDIGEKLLEIVMGYVHDGRRRLIEYRQRR